MCCQGLGSAGWAAACPVGGRRSRAAPLHPCTPQPNPSRHHLGEAAACLGRYPRVAAELELGCEELRGAARALGRVTGAIDTEQVLDQLFAEFCIGK